MNDLVEFLKARLDKDEQVAREAGGAPWSAPIPGMVHVDAKAIADNKLAWGKLGYVATVEHEHDRNHITRHNPARVLREVEAARATISDYEHAIQKRDQYAPNTGSYRHWDNRSHGLYRSLQRYAAIHADHPDYLQEWKP